ncbi:hypothetical protein ACIP68_16015 [Streptomyces griseoviridis]
MPVPDADPLAAVGGPELPPAEGLLADSVAAGPSSGTSVTASVGRGGAAEAPVIPSVAR